MHAYDPSCRAKCQCAHCSLVGVQRKIQNNGIVKSEPKYLACEESQIRAFYFCSSVTLLASTVD